MSGAQEARALLPAQTITLTLTLTLTLTTGGPRALLSAQTITLTLTLTLTTGGPRALRAPRGTEAHAAALRHGRLVLRVLISGHGCGVLTRYTHPRAGVVAWGSEAV